MFLKNCSLDEARAKLLVQLGRILEAAEVYAKNWDMLKAVELLTTSDTHDVDFARRRIEYLLAGLQRDLTIGLLPTSSPTASKLLSFTGRLDKGAMTKQEVNEVNIFYGFDLRVLHSSTPSLQCLKQSSVPIVQASARSRGPLLRLGITPPLCSAWITFSRPLPSYEVSRSPRFRHRSPFSMTTFAC